MNFADRELEILKNKEFLLTKAKVSSKIRELLSITSLELKNIYSESDLSFPSKSAFKSSKISKGENYRGLPYMVLDYPAFFSKNNIFAFRTMFWWGNFFSATLHLQGVSLEHYQEKIIKQMPKLFNQQIFISIGNSPWEYHYGEDNYRLVEEAYLKTLRNKAFCKLSKKLYLDKWDELPSFSSKFFSKILDVLS